MTDEKKFYQHLEYLNKWKPELDRKSYNGRVTEALTRMLPTEAPLRVLDCGAGTGIDIIQLIDSGIIREAEIKAFDIDSNLIRDMPRIFSEYARNKGLDFKMATYPSPDDFEFSVKGKDTKIYVRGFAANLYKLTNPEVTTGKFDLITGQAFIEHVNHDLAYPLLRSMLKSDGLVYFSMNCDGWFNYAPSSNPERDEKIIGLFNDLALNNQEFERVLGGEAFCGRNLPYKFKENNLEVLAYGPSDWVITPNQQSEGEMNFIKYTLDYIFSQCSDPQTRAEELRVKYGLKRDEITDWYIEKLKAIEDRSIGFTCVQKDILGRKNGGESKC